MVQQENVADASQMVAWLEEQRKLDRDQMVKVQQEVEHLESRVKELTAQLQQLSEEAKLERSRLATIPFAEEGIRQLREQVALLLQRVDARDQAADRDTMLRQTEAERDRKVVIEITQQMTQLARQVEQGQSKIQPLTEEIKRDHVEIQGVISRIDNSERATSTAAGRIQLLEEFAKRFDNRIAALEQGQETVRADCARLQQWQQAAELRWSRQVGQWQEQMDEWKREVGTQINAIQQLAKQTVQIRDEMQGIRESAIENRKLIDGQAAQILLIENVRSHDLDAVSRLEQTIELQRRRIDEQSSIGKILQEQLMQADQGLIDLQGRIDGERKRIDETGITIKQLDAKQEQTVDEILQLGRALREQSYAVTQQEQAWQQQLDQLQREWEQQLMIIARLDEQQKVREIAEMEHQLAEIRERLGKTKSWGTS